MQINSPSGFLQLAVKNRNRDRNQNSNDGNDNQQFGKGKSFFESAHHTHLPFTQGGGSTGEGSGIRPPAPASAGGAISATHRSSDFGN